MISVFAAKATSNHCFKSIDLLQILHVRYKGYALCGAKDYVLQQVQRLLLPDRTDVDTVTGVCFCPDVTLPMTSFNWVSAPLIIGKENNGPILVDGKDYHM